MQKSLSLFFKCKKIVFFTIKISFQVNNFGFIDLTRELPSGKYGNIYPIFFCHNGSLFFIGKHSNHTIFRHANFIGCLSADKIKMPVRKYFCFNIPVYRNMAEEPSCRSPYHEEYIQTSVSGNSEGLCRSTYSFLSERR